ncbi:MAG: DUF433 domain-containing protein [Bacteroidota bacterium]
MDSTKAAYWMQYITVDEEVLAGKPTIKGTRLSVEFLLERLASGWTEADILENYPRLNRAALQAVFAYVYDCMQDGLLYMPHSKAA